MSTKDVISLLIEAFQTQYLRTHHDVKKDEQVLVEHQRIITQNFLDQFSLDCYEKSKTITEWQQGKELENIDMYWILCYKFLICTFTVSTQSMCRFCGIVVIHSPCSAASHIEFPQVLLQMLVGHNGRTCNNVV